MAEITMRLFQSLFNTKWQNIIWGSYIQAIKINRLPYISWLTWLT